MKRKKLNNHLRFENLSEVELSYKYKVKPSSLPQITSSADAYDLLVSIWQVNKIEYVEEFKIILLNKSNRVLGWFKVSSGGVSGTVADPRIIFQTALLSNASGIILAHNHPSGNIFPSEPDIQLTKKMKEAGKVLEIPVLDHLIITSESYYSFADEGKL
jgi:DNA repair protein RadC